jgi:anti-sigma regulatory factor (Ser/Thr protein kinase)
MMLRPLSALPAEKRIETLALTLPSEPESGAVARRHLEAFLDSGQVDVPAVLLAVSEAITNAVVHGYRGHRDGVIEVSATQDPDGVRVVVSDWGVGMSPNPEHPGLGFGLAVIGAFAETVQVEGIPGGGTKLTMRFASA